MTVTNRQASGVWKPPQQRSDRPWGTQTSYPPVTNVDPALCKYFMIPSCCFTDHMFSLRHKELQTSHYGFVWIQTTSFRLDLCSALLWGNSGRPAFEPDSHTWKPPQCNKMLWCNTECCRFCLNFVSTLWLGFVKTTGQMCQLLSWSPFEWTSLFWIRYLCVVKVIICNIISNVFYNIETQRNPNFVQDNSAFHLVTCHYNIWERTGGMREEVGERD